MIHETESLMSFRALLTANISTITTYVTFTIPYQMFLLVRSHFFKQFSIISSKSISFNTFAHPCAIKQL